jgi:prepilin-type N-terminal cleavage/methylation domain-containing protein
LLNKKSAFTLLEILIAAAILSVVLACLFTTLNIGQLSFSMNSAKVELQSYVRLVMDRLVKDVRDTNLLEINNNSPSVDHIKFRKVSGIDNGSGSYTLSANYIEYTYDGNSGVLTRNIIDGSNNILQSLTYNDITQSPFYIASGNPLVANGILTSKSLFIVISAQKQTRGSNVLNFSLTEEVKIRNE